MTYPRAALAGLLLVLPSVVCWSSCGGFGALTRVSRARLAISPPRRQVALSGAQGARAALENGFIKVHVGNGLRGQMLPASMTEAISKWIWHDGRFCEVKHDGVTEEDPGEGWVDPFRYSTLEATQGQILSQSPTDATSGRWHLNGS